MFKAVFPLHHIPVYFSIWYSLFNFSVHCSLYLNLCKLSICVGEISEDKERLFYSISILSPPSSYIYIHIIHFLARTKFLKNHFLAECPQIRLYIFGDWRVRMIFGKMKCVQWNQVYFFLTLYLNTWIICEKQIVSILLSGTSCMFTDELHSQPCRLIFPRHPKCLLVCVLIILS